MSTSEAIANLVVFFAGLAASIWSIYLVIKIAEHVNAWPF